MIVEQIIATPYGTFVKATVDGTGGWYEADARSGGLDGRRVVLCAPVTFEVRTAPVKEGE